MNCTVGKVLGNDLVQFCILQRRRAKAGACKSLSKLPVFLWVMQRLGSRSCLQTSSGRLPLQWREICKVVRKDEEEDVLSGEMLGPLSVLSLSKLLPMELLTPRLKKLCSVS